MAEDNPSPPPLRGTMGEYCTWTQNRSGFNQFDGKVIRDLWEHL
ncbi:hypothetical protein A2U01_0109100, partial [Trifolium medium]|nr:hypothetical protein [Trifolium medium]